MKFNRARTLSSLVVLALIATACSEKKKLDDMHKATNEMRESTADMNERTKELAETSSDIDEKTAEMYRDLKQGDSLAARRASMIAMVDAKDSVRKISEAAKYFMSFEFQLWSGIGHDTEKERENLGAASAREFFRDVQEYIVGSAPKPFATGDKGDDDEGNRLRVLNSISVTLQYVNLKQDDILKKHTKLKPMTMLTMIQEALEARPRIDSGEKTLADFPLYVQEILPFEDVAIHLLQVRHNFFLAMNLSQVSSLKQGKVAFLAGLVLPGSTWEADLTKYNAAQLATFVRYLKGSAQAGSLLSKVGVQPELTWEMKVLYKKMRIKQNGAVSASVGGEKLAFENEYAGLVAKIQESLK